MKHRQKKSPVWKVIVFIFFVIVFAMVLVRLNKEREMRARVEQRSRELADAAAQALASGTLEYDPDARCDHHGEHHDGGCGHDHCEDHYCHGN